MVFFLCWRTLPGEHITRKITRVGNLVMLKIFFAELSTIKLKARTYNKIIFVCKPFCFRVVTGFFTGKKNLCKEGKVRGVV